MNFITETTLDTTIAAHKKDAAFRNADSYFQTWQQRTSLVKEQAAAESAANDAKTARLRALRLAKEAADKEKGRHG